MSSAFKYYIHDTSKGFSLQIRGAFTETSVAELACCWETAKSTLKDRTLTLDMRGVTSLDEPARRWLASMSQDGAKHLPEAFLLDTVAGLPGDRARQKETPKPNLFCRLLRFAPKPAR